MCGAALNSTTVAISVNRVKAIRQSRSSTMAAYFQSLTTSMVSSLARMVSVIILDTDPDPQRGLTDQHLLDLLEYEGELPGVVRGGGGGGGHAGHGMMSAAGVVTRGQGHWPVREGPTNNS